MAMAKSLGSKSIIKPPPMPMVNNSLSRKKRRLHIPETDRPENDLNTSILTQCSHTTYRPPINKDEIERYLNTSVSSLQSTNTNYLSTTLGEISELEDKWEETTIDPQDNGEKNVTPKSSRKIMNKTKSPKKFPHSEKHKSVIELFDWIIRPLPDVKGVCVEGQKKGMTDFWHSSAITDVKKHKFVKTASGTVYRLKGGLNKLCTLETGFSKSVTNAFANGFPTDWKEVLEDFYSSLEKSITVSDECSVIRGYSLKRLGGMHHKKVSAVKKGEQDKKTFDSLDSILTPVGLVKRSNSAQHFTTTRSGRLSLPPLAHWQGQRYIISKKSNTLKVGFQTAIGEEALLKETKDFMKVLKNFQKPMYHKSLSNSIMDCSSSTHVTNFSKKHRQEKQITSSKLNGTTRSIHQIVVSESSDKKNPVVSVLNNSGDNSQQKQKYGAMDENGTLKTVEMNPIVQLICCIDDKSKTKSVRTRNIDTLKQCNDSKNKSKHSIKSPPSNSSRHTVNTDETLNKTIDTSPESSCFNHSMVLRNKKLRKSGKSNDFLEGDDVQLCQSNAFSRNEEAHYTPASESVLNCSMVLRSRKIVRYDVDNEEYTPTVFSGAKKKSRSNAYSKNQSISKHTKYVQIQKTAVKQKSEEGKRERKKHCTSGNRLKPVCKLDSCMSSEAYDGSEKKIGCDKKNRTSRCSRKRKCESPSSDDTGYCTEEQSCLKMQQELTPKSCGKRPVRKRRMLSLPTETGHKDVWRVEERKLFERALKSIDGNSPTFWYQVSNIVTSKTEAECREFHAIYLEQNTKKVSDKSKKVSRKSSGRQKGDPVRGGKGTLKRKEGMREFLREQDEDYEDNPFEGSPFVSRKLPVPMITNINFDKGDDEIFGSNHNFFTPMAKNINIGTPGTRMRAQLASTRKTPVNQPNRTVNDTPVSLVRQVADKYIHTLMNQQKRNPHEGNASTTEIQVENTNNMNSSTSSKLPFKSLFSPSIVVYDKERELDDDNEEENNPFIYYWNEDGNE